MKKFYALLLSFFLLAGATQAQLIVFDDDYAAGVTFATFGGAVNALSIDASNARPGSAGTKSLKAEVPAGGYTGGALVAAANQNATAFNAVSFWVKASKSATLNVAGLGNNAAVTTFASELIGGIPVSTSWIRVILPVPDASKLTSFNGLWHFAEGSDEGAYTLWFDDIQFENIGGGVIGTPSVVMDNQTLTKAVGGTFFATGVRATFPVSSVPRQVTVAPAFLTYTSNPAGRITFDQGVCTAATSGAATVTAALGAVTASGTINVTVSAGSNEPTTAAPEPPSRLPAEVISVFSDKYTNIGGVNFNPGWGQSTIYSEVLIAGNPTKKYTNANYQGFEITPAMNLTGMNKLHFDVWSPDATEFKFFLISLGPTVEAATTVTPTLSGWKSVDVDLSGFSPVVLTNVGQMKFEVKPFGSSTIYLDNIYFYKQVITSLVPTVAAPDPPARAAADVISIFSDKYTNIDGVNFNPGWGQSTIYSEVLIAGNATKRYENLNYQGFELTPALDLTGMNKMHFDLWTPNATSFQFFLINLNPTVERAVTVTPAGSQWVQVDVDLSNFSPIDITKILQFKLESQPFGTSNVWMDNIYFYRDGSLPVKLVSFTASKKENGVMLNWQTATETNNRGFAVERSRDGQTWSEFSFVKATAANGLGSQYTLVDANPLKGMNYYRLKQVDMDGTATYSVVKVVNFKADGAALSIYPNPTKGRVNVLVSDLTGKVSYNIVQLNGKTVLSGAFGNGNTVNTIDVSSLPAGTYLINIIGNQFSKTEKLILQ